MNSKLQARRASFHIASVRARASLVRPAPPLTLPLRVVLVRALAGR